VRGASLHLAVVAVGVLGRVVFVEQVEDSTTLLAGRYQGCHLLSCERCSSLGTLTPLRRDAIQEAVLRHLSRVPREPHRSDVTPEPYAHDLLGPRIRWAEAVAQRVR